MSIVLHQKTQWIATQDPRRLGPANVRIWPVADQVRSKRMAVSALLRSLCKNCGTLRCLMFTVVRLKCINWHM